MIHVVSSYNQHLYARQLDEMFRMRHEFYVKHRGWTNLTSSSGRETDEFDDDNAVYLMNLDQYGKILSTFRLNPTTGPYLVADKLPHYLSEPAPRQDDIWDLGRWMVAPQARRKKAGEIADVQKPLICAVMEFAVQNGIKGFTALSDTAFIERISKVWPTRYMGKPHGFDDAPGESVLVMIEAGPHVLAQTRNRTGLYESVLFDIQPDLNPSPSEKIKRKQAMDAVQDADQNDIKRIREAADQMLTALTAPKDESGNVQESIQTVEAFTRYIRDVSGRSSYEDA